MAIQILASAPSNKYQLPEKDRQTLLLGADNPSGKISKSQLVSVERQRASFTEKYEDEFGQK